MIIVVGAGAAGLTAAIFASGGHRQVTVLESTGDGGRKILISGGGRCNVLPSVVAHERFVTDSEPRRVRALLRSWPLPQQHDFFERQLQIPLSVETSSGKVFPTSNRARDVRDALVDYARRAGVTFRFATRLTALESRDGGWLLQTTQGPLESPRVILATGGLSVPSTGSDGGGLTMAKQLGHRVHELYPALTPLTADPPVHADLSGVSLPVRLRARDGRRTHVETGGFLFTHRGYSGPAVLDISHVAVRSRTRPTRASVRVQWCEMDAAAWDSVLTAADSSIATTIARHLPQRLTAQLMHEAGVPAHRRTSMLPRAERKALVERLTSYLLPWAGDEGFKKAEVTGGGIALDEVDPHTLESRTHPGLFFCGEMLDAFGPIGGHNFVWAWATGRLAGLGARAT